MINKTIAQKFSGHDDVRGQHLSQLKRGGSVGGIAHHLCSALQCLQQSRGQEPVVVDRHYFGQVAAVPVSMHGRLAVGRPSHGSSPVTTAAGPSHPAARALATA